VYHKVPSKFEGDGLLACYAVSTGKRHNLPENFKRHWQSYKNLKCRKVYNFCQTFSVNRPTICRY